MSNENLLQVLHIQKLGHNIEEIRIRALYSIISKYNLNLVDENNLENTRLLLEKLFEWFNFDACSEDNKVLDFILKILKTKNADIIISEIGVKNILKNISDIEKKIGLKFPLKIKELKHIIGKIGNQSDTNQIINSQPSDNKLKITSSKSFTPSIYSNEKNLWIENDSASSVASKQLNGPCGNVFVNKTVKKQSDDSTLNKSTYKIIAFPWQHLVANDKQVFSVIFNGLKYVDDKISVCQACQFFNEVVLRDFPPEVFIQRPVLMRAFLKLIEILEVDSRIPVLKCLYKIVQRLKNNMKLMLNASLFNQKKEFYSTNVFPNDRCDKKNNDLVKINLFEQLNLKSYCFPDTFNYNSDAEEHKLKTHQLTISQFCFEIILQILPQLKKLNSLEEINYLIKLGYESLISFIINLLPGNWMEDNDLKDKLYRIFALIFDLLIHFKSNDKMIYIVLVSITVKVLIFLKPAKVTITEILPKKFNLELGGCLLDSTIYFTFPHLHLKILDYMKQLADQKEKETVQDYKDLLIILESMKSCCKFIKYKNKFKTKMDCLECLHNAIPSLDFHQNLDFINCFLNYCLLTWSKTELTDKEAEIRCLTLLKLLSHNNTVIKSFMYKKISECAEKLLGGKEAAHPTLEFPGDKMDFLFYEDILTEIICHGLNSELKEIQNSSSNILIHLLKGRYILSEHCWNDFLNNLIPCIDLLECFADKSTILGRCIIKMFDPDVARSIRLPQIEILKGNIRLLFSKNNLTRDEAISRLFWLLSKDDPDGKKLPRTNVIMDLNLNEICVSVKPQEYSYMKQSFYNPGKLCDVLEMICSDALEPDMRRSALSQIAVMLEDDQLHSTFLEQKGLKKILNILDISLIEKDYRNYPDFVLPIIDILKLLCMNSVLVCHELCTKIYIFYDVIRSLFLFSSDERLRRNAVELLCLLLFNSCSLRVPAEKSGKNSISFPEIIVKKMTLPFLTYTHWKKSKHLEPSMKKIFMNKENCWKLIKIYWASLWTGSLSDILTIQSTDFKKKISSPGIPDDMKLQYSDFEELRKCSFNVSVKHILYDIQNATTHDNVYYNLQKLDSYFILFNVNKSSTEQSSSDIASDTVLSHMLWESTLERFLISTPACIKDESLLLGVLQFVQLLLGSFKSERLINWLEKLLTDENKPLFRLLRNLESKNSGLKNKDLRLSIIELARQIIQEKATVEPRKWFLYMKLITNHLKLDNRKEFYNVAFVDWLTELLVDLTGKCSFTDDVELLSNLIIRIMEIVIAFHCTQDLGVSFLGMNIVRNSLLVLNHILSDLQSTEGWEEIWIQSLSKVTGHTNSANYCWLLSLWFARDPILRAAAFQFFAGLASTSKGCDLLINHLNIPIEHIWEPGFRVFFDQREACLVREKCGLMLTSLTKNIPSKSGTLSFDQFIGTDFYENLYDMVNKFQSKANLCRLKYDEINNTFIGETVTTPALITSISTLLQNMISLDIADVPEKIVDTGLLECFFRVLSDVPESASSCDHHQYCIDILQMYTGISRLVTTSVTSRPSAHKFMLQSSNAINKFFAMVNYKLYCETSKTIGALKYDLWLEILNLFSALLKDLSPNDNEEVDNLGFDILYKCLIGNGVGDFITSLYIAVASDSPPLRLSVLQFFINLLNQELKMRNQISIGDIFEQNISERAVKLIQYNGSKEITVSENLTLNFGIRMVDILLQIYGLSTDCQDMTFKKTTSDALGSLLAAYRPAQDFCLTQNLAATLVLNLKQVCVKLSLENPSNLKKLTDKKRIEPLLDWVEILSQLVNNFTYGNEKAKIEMSSCGLSVVIHKLWPWCIMKPSLLCVILKMLCTLTYSCNQGCRSLVLSSNFTVISFKKMPGSITLMNSIINQIIVEMDLITKTSQTEMLALYLQLLSNCCNVIECRTVMAKGNLLLSFAKLQSVRKKRLYIEKIVGSWLRFFVVFSSYQEGHLSLVKNQNVLDAIIQSASSVQTTNRVDALITLRNICFRQHNRYRMLSYCPFLTLLRDLLNSNNREELQQIIYSLWALACNSQKAKLLLRNAGFEIKLEAVKRNCTLNDDEETKKLTSVVLDILKNK